MIIEDAAKYLTKPSDAIDPVLNVTGNTVEISFEPVDNSYYIVVVKDIKSDSGAMLDSPLVFQVSSQYSPILVTPTAIRSEFLYLDATDDELLRLIRSVSLELLNAKPDIDVSNPPFAAQQYVKYMTVYSYLLVKNVINASSLASRMTLGDFSVANDTTGDISKAALSELYKKAQYWYNQLMSKPTRATAQYFVKGGDSYPDFLSRGF